MRDPFAWLDRVPRPVTIALWVLIAYLAAGQLDAWCR